MKKTIFILLVFTHLLSSVGFSMNVHQCGSNKSYTLIGLSLGSYCSCDHEDQSHLKNCCKDKKIVVKAQKKECISNKIFIVKYISEIDFLPHSFKFTKLELPEKNNITVFTGHPPNLKTSLYLFYNVYRI